MVRRCGDRHCSRYCVWCADETKGSVEVFLAGRWMPVCTVCCRAHRNLVARTLAGVEAGFYAFRSSKPGLAVLQGEAPASPQVASLDRVPRAIKRLWESLPNGGRVM
jgi:hypothetical protein